MESAVLTVMSPLFDGGVPVLIAGTSKELFITSGLWSSAFRLTPSVSGLAAIAASAVYGAGARTVFILEPESPEKSRAYESVPAAISHVYEAKGLTPQRGGVFSIGSEPPAAIFAFGRTWSELAPTLADAVSTGPLSTGSIATGRVRACRL